MVSYVVPISKLEPFLISNYLCYFGKNQLVFIGYPLGIDFDERILEKTLKEAVEKFKPENVAVIAPELPSVEEVIVESDEYFLLDLRSLKISKKLRNALARASKDLVVERGKIAEEHHKLIQELLKMRSTDERTKYIFENIPAYTSSSPTAIVLDARDKNRSLAAFSVIDFSRDYAFYMFSFISRENYVPGASDLLFNEFVKMAQEKGKKYINMGLGINEGVRKFKEKWGGRPFLDYEFIAYSKV
ncbi:MAG: hypothetical protein ABH874_04350 [Methanobacteriota archaeon]